MKRLPLLLMLSCLLVPGAVALAQGLLPSVLTTNTALQDGYREARVLSLEPHIELVGSDPDGYPYQRPTYYRYLYKPAKLGQVYVNTEYYFEQYMDQLVSWDDPHWSAWIPWSADENVVPRTVFKERDMFGDIAYYLLALQVMDADGAVSVERTYGRTVHNFRVSSSLRPVLTVRESDFGTFVYSGIEGSWAFDVAPGQPLLFTWLGTADPAAGEIIGYRWGWDVADPTDDQDPGWALPGYGTAAAYRTTGEQTFSSGIHTLTVECLAEGMPVTRIVFTLDVVPIPDLADRLPLLLVDDVNDHVSNGWPSQFGGVSYDADASRDARWLELIGDVAGFDPQRDVVDLEGGVPYGFRDIVPYRALIWSSRSHPQSYVATHFNDFSDYNWLAAYQENAGNVLLAGAGSVINFAQNRAVPDTPIYEWLFPVIYDCIEGNITDWWGTLARSYGLRNDGPQQYVVRGLESYGYRTLGLALVDPFASNTEALLDDLPCTRRDSYVGTKRLTLDPAFAALHDPAGTLPVEVGPDPLIDWADGVAGIPDPASVYVFTAHEEFYDVNVSGRTTVWASQERPGGGPMIEPMWRNVSRWDWILDAHRAAGNNDFPTQDDIDLAQLGCEEVTFDGVLLPGGDVRTLTGGVPTGFFSFATVESKPTGRADVVWGFDPTRFDPDAMGRTVRWVLGEHFGLPVAPAAREVSR